MSREDVYLMPNIQIREEDPEGYRSYSLPRIQKVTLIVLLTLSLAFMGSFVYLQTVSFPCDQFLLAQLYTLVYALLYAITYIVLLGRESISYLSRFEAQHVAIIGFFWVTNYTFFFISATHISSSMQILITQLQVIIVVLIDYYFVGIKIDHYKLLCICTYVGGNMMAIGAIGITIGLGDIFWVFIFLIGAISSGMANIYSEIYIKSLVFPHNSFMDKLKCTIAINMLSNLIGIPITFLAIPLGKYAIGVDAPLYDFSIFSSKEIWYWVGLLFSSYLYTICSYFLLHSESTVYTTMCMGMGLFLQLCFFMTPSTKYQEIPHGLVIFAAIIVVLASIAYIIKPEKRNNNLMRKSTYRLTTTFEYFNTFLSIVYILLVGIYFLVDTIIPLLPPMDDCYDHRRDYSSG